MAELLTDLVESFSGIRGIYGKSITEDFAKRYALSYCRLFENHLSALVVGGDSRDSTSPLKQAMIEAFQARGIKKIIDVGIAPVQIAEYAVQKFGADGGVYISASHNEPEYNGWKFLKQDGAILYPKQLDKLVKLVHSAQFSESPPVSTGAGGKDKSKVINKHNEATELYIDFILQAVSKEAVERIKRAKIKLLVDPNGGAGIVVLEKLFNKLGVEAKIINNKLGEFNRLIEPKRESLAYLAKRMKTGEFEFACGFDCDADRVEFVINPDSEFAQRIKTPVVSGHYVLALACDALLQGTQGQVVVTNDATSYLVRDVIKKHQAVTKEVEVGEINVIEEMDKNKSIIGGEGSCAGVIVSPIKCRDGIITTILILKMLAERNKSLSQVLEEYPKYYSARTKVNCLAERAIDVRNKIEQSFRERGFSVKKTGDETGGLKALQDENSYVWFRQSKTEPGAFRIHAEGDSAEKVKQLLQQGIDVFTKFQN